MNGRLCLILLPEVVAVAGLDDEVLLFGDGELKLVVADCVALVERIGEAVLVAQIFLNLRVDLFHRFFLGDLEEAPARFSGNLVEDFLAVGARFLSRIPSALASLPNWCSPKHTPRLYHALSYELTFERRDGCHARIPGRPSRASGASDPGASHRSLRRRPRCGAVALDPHASPHA